MRTLVVAMDAADDELVLGWAAAGLLPNLGSLLAEGSAVRLSSETLLGPEAAQASTITGCMPASHGYYDYRCVVPGTNRRVLAPLETRRKQFWSHLAANGRSTPMLLFDFRHASPIDDGSVTQVLGWGERGTTRQHSLPPSLLAEITRAHGRYPTDELDREHEGNPRRARRQLAMLRRLADVRSRAAAGLLRDHDWELALVGCYESHAAGHLFHRYLDWGPWEPERAASALQDSLLEVYRAFDEGFGEMIEAAGEGTNVIVFSPLGLRPNTSGTRALEDMLVRLGYHVRRTSSGGARRMEGLRRVARAALPWSLRWKLKRRVADDFHRHLEKVWVESTDWGRTRAYAETEPGHSFVRINRAIVGDPRSLREEIGAELLALEDADTGTPAVTRVATLDEFGQGASRGDLPDLSVFWTRDALLRRIRHPRAGVAEEELRGLQRTEHSLRGFAIAAGPSITRRDRPLEGHVIDLAPTVLHLAGAEIPLDMEGEPLTELVSGVEPPQRAPIPTENDPWRDD